jgi:hypothetical protein
MCIRTTRRSVARWSHPRASPSWSATSRENELKAVIVEGLAPYRTDDGSYQLRNVYHYLIARA